RLKISPWTAHHASWCGSRSPDGLPGKVAKHRDSANVPTGIPRTWASDNNLPPPDVSCFPVAGDAHAVQMGNPRRSRDLCDRGHTECRHLNQSFVAHSFATVVEQPPDNSCKNRKLS